MTAKVLFAAALVTLTAFQAAAVPLTVATEKTETKGVLGLSIPIGGDGLPRVSIGVRQLTIGSGGDLSGAELRVKFNPAKAGDVQLRALALDGTVDHAGALGGGWDFGAGHAFGSAGVVLPYLSGVADFGLGGLAPRISIGIDSLGRPDAPARRVIDLCPTHVPSSPIAAAC